VDADDRLAVYERQLKRTVNSLIKLGKRVVIIYPIPEHAFTVPSAVGRFLVSQRDPTQLGSPYQQFLQRHKDILEMLDRVGSTEGVTRLYPHKRLCDSKRCHVYANGVPLYRDDDHLSGSGVSYALRDLEAVFSGSEQTRSDEQRTISVTAQPRQGDSFSTKF
jgi:hypothetical protein